MGLTEFKVLLLRGDRLNMTVKIVPTRLKDETWLSVSSEVTWMFAIKIDCGKILEKL